MYENLVGNVKEFLMISSKIYTPEVRNSDKKTCESSISKNQCCREITTQKEKNLFKKLLPTYQSNIFYIFPKKDSL